MKESTVIYASVECKERNRDPLTTNLVVADQSRTEKTICLAVSPSLKSYGIPGRPRLFEVVQKIKEVNNTRRWKALNRTFTGSSDDNTELNANPALKVDYIVAPPRMEYYLEYSSKIYNIYLKYIAPEDIYRCNRLSEYLSDDCKGTCHDYDTRRFKNNGNYSNRRNRNEYVSVQDCDGYRSKAY